MLVSKQFKIASVLVAFVLLGLMPNEAEAQIQPTEPRGSGSAAGESPKPPPSSNPKPAVTTAPPAKSGPAKITAGPFADGLWHMTFGSVVSKPGCVTITQEQLAADDAPLYVCRSADDNHYRVVHGAEIGEPYVQVTKLGFTKEVIYRGQDDAGRWYQILGKTRTQDGMGSGGYSLHGFSGGDEADDSSAPPPPKLNACGRMVQDYILAKGDALVALLDSRTGDSFVCWGRDQGPMYSHIFALAFVNGHVVYVAQTSDGLYHMVKDKVVGKGYAHIDDVVYDGDHVIYRAQDGSQQWHVIQDAVEGQPFDEMGRLGYSFQSHRLLYAARRSAATSTPRL